MNAKQVEVLLEQVCCEGVLELECPLCETTITTEPDATDLYCDECKQIVMQNPLTALGFI